MTIALSIRVHAGVVFAADSATTFKAKPGRGAVKIYYQAQKIAQLHDFLPIGLLTWGLGTIGSDSIAMIARRIRLRLNDVALLDPSDYRLEDVARAVADTLHGEYQASFKGVRNPPELGIVVAGYGSGDRLAAEWEIKIQGAAAPNIAILRDGRCGASAFGQPEAFHRLMRGRAPLFERWSELVGMSPRAMRRSVAVMQTIEEFFDPVLPNMPLADAIDLAEYLAQTEVAWHRFNPLEAAPTVGGPVAVASLTREGFRWHRRPPGTIDPLAGGEPR